MEVASVGDLEFYEGVADLDFLVVRLGDWYGFGGRTSQEEKRLRALRAFVEDMVGDALLDAV